MLHCVQHDSLALMSFSLPHYGGSARRAREANLLTTLADRDPQGTTRIRATCDLSLLALSKASPFLVNRSTLIVHKGNFQIKSVTDKITT